MDKSEQGARVDARANGELLMISQSRSSNGLMGGHGKYTKLRIDDGDAVIGGALRACLNNRNPGFHHPHRFKEKEAFEAMMKEYLADRGIASDKIYYKGTRSVVCSEYANRIELLATDNSRPGRAAWIQNAVPVVVSIEASDIELARALREALAMCIV